MKYFLFISVLTGYSMKIAAQTTIDSLLHDHWVVQQHKGLFGFSKPAFGNYTTVSISKIDSPVIRSKTKDSTYFGMDIFSEKADADFNKFQTIQKKKWFMLLLSTSTDTITINLAITAVSHERKQTLLGKMMSKDDEDKDEELDYKKDIYGIIKFPGDSSLSNLFIYDLRSYNVQPGMSIFPPFSMQSAYIKCGDDSLTLQQGFNNSFVLRDTQEKKLAEILFNQKKPVINIYTSTLLYQQSAAVLFAVIISTKDY